MKRKINKDAVNDLNEEYNNNQSQEETTDKSKKTKKAECDKYRPVYLPTKGLFEDDDDDYFDTFTQRLIVSLRRMAFDVGMKNKSEAYVRDTENNDWLLLAWDYDQYGNVVLDKDFKRSNKALKRAIKDAGKPIFDELYKNLVNLEHINPVQLEAMVKGQLPIKFLKDNKFRLIYNGFNYVVDTEFEKNLLNYTISLIENLDSPIQALFYITNDKSQKDNARYYYDITPSKEHFDVAPKLEDYSKFWFKFLRNRFNNERMDLLRLTHHIYGLMCAECHSRQSLAIFDGGNTGKSVLKDALAAILPGAVQTGITLDSLCGRFPPSQINGCRGLIIDEGKALQAFFDGDFFKGITGATNDNAMQVADQKFKDQVMMRLGSIRFTFMTNSSLCIHDKAGLTRLSPMFFKCNFGRLRLNGNIVAELASEGKAFLQFCIDNETYYKNITSKKNHWYCPLIEDNGNINILTDEQFDAWLNETSDELYFSEEDQTSPEMRKRLEQINLDNCIKATTDPETGNVRVYGSLDNEITSTEMQNLFNELFIENPDAFILKAAFAKFIYEQLKNTKSQFGDKLRGVGFKFTNETTVDSVARSRVWNNLMNQLQTRFKSVNVNKRVVVNNQKCRCIYGLQAAWLPLDDSNTDATRKEFDE